MDDLLRIKGIGRATAKRLVTAGIDSAAALSALDPADERLASNDIKVAEATDWIAQAKALVDADAVAENPQEKPQRSADEPEAHSRDGAGLPADSRAGDRQSKSTDTPESEAAGGGAGDWTGPAAAEAEEDEARRLYPRFFAERDRIQAEIGKAKGPVKAKLRITAKRDGFRRAGMRHAGTVDHEVFTFTLPQIEQLLGEPNLAVSFVMEDAA